MLADGDAVAIGRVPGQRMLGAEEPCRKSSLQNIACKERLSQKFMYYGQIHTEFFQEMEEVRSRHASLQSELIKEMSRYGSLQWGSRSDVFSKVKTICMHHTELALI